VTSRNRSRSDAKAKFAERSTPASFSPAGNRKSFFDEEAGNMNAVTSNDAPPCAIIGAHVFQTRFASPLLAAARS